jgi:hypothetical protein
MGRHEDLSIQYPGEHAPQPAFLYFDPERRIAYARPDYNVGHNSAPMDCVHGLVLGWPIPNTLDTDDLHNLIHEITPLLETIADGYECVWNGHDYVGEYSCVAERAIDQVDDIVSCIPWEDEDEDEDEDEGSLDYWDLEEWLNVDRLPTKQAAKELDITTATTDAELDAMAESFNDEAASQSVTFTNDPVDYLYNLRRKLAEGDDD